MRVRMRAALAVAGAAAVVIGGLGVARTIPAAADGATMKLSPASQNVASTASSVKVDVMVEGAVGVGAFDFTIQYDKDLLELQTVAEGTFLATSGITPSCYQGNAENFPAGLVNYGCGTIASGGIGAGASGSGVLATITFKPKAKGSSPLVYINPTGFAAPNGDTLAISPADGVVKIVDPGEEDSAPLAATPTVNPSARTPTGRPPAERDPFVRDGSGAATPAPGGSASSGAGSSGSSGTGAQSGTLSGAAGGVRGQGATSGAGSAAGGAGPRGGPIAGTGYQQEERSPWWPALYAALALGAGLLVGGATLRKKRTQ